MNTADVLTHSSARCARSCPRKYLLRYEYGLRPEDKGYALKVGSAFAAAVEAQAKGLSVDDAIDGQVDDPFDMALVAAMFHGHETRWADEPLEHVAAELAFSIPLVNPETGRPTPNFTLDGKIDRIARLPDGRLALVEYKTTSRDFAPGADYWLALHMDYQLSIYVIAARSLGYDVSTILYDVTRRPQQRPLKATPLDVRKYTTDKATGERRLYANQREDDETPEEFAARVSAAIAESPDKHFARIEVARLDADLDECRADLWAQQRTIQQAKTAGRWYRNPDACISSTGQRCEFLSICQLSDLKDRTPLGFERVDDVHPELSDARTGPAVQVE